MCEKESVNQNKTRKMFQWILSILNLTDCYLRPQLLCNHDKSDFGIWQSLVDRVDWHPWKNEEEKQINLSLERNLTVSHLAFSRSCSNFANSRRSCSVANIRQTIKQKRPKAKILETMMIMVKRTDKTRRQPGIEEENLSLRIRKSIVLLLVFWTRNISWSCSVW